MKERERQRDRETEREIPECPSVVVKSDKSIQN